MHQLEQWYSELRRSLQHRSVVIDKGEDPVFFVVYPPRMTLRIYKELPSWKARLRSDGFLTRTFDLGMALESFIADHEHYPEIVEYLRDNPEEIEAARRSIADLLMKDRQRTILEDWVAAEIKEATELHGDDDGSQNRASGDQGLLFLTGIEHLHPYLQIGRIEQSLQGRITCPVVVFYPGLRTSAFGLRYLGFYPADGNYRSRHIGGTYR